MASLKRIGPWLAYCCHRCHSMEAMPRSLSLLLVPLLLLLGRTKNYSGQGRANILPTEAHGNGFVLPLQRTHFFPFRCLSVCWATSSLAAQNPSIRRALSCLRSNATVQKRQVWNKGRTVCYQCQGQEMALAFSSLPSQLELWLRFVSPSTKPTSSSASPLKHSSMVVSISSTSLHRPPRWLALLLRWLPIYKLIEALCNMVAHRHLASTCDKV